MNPRDEIWDLLNRPELKTLPERLHPDRLPLGFSDCLQYFRNQSGPKIISLRDLTPADNTCLADAGISPEHLIRNLIRTVCGRQFYSRAFQLIALRENAVYAYSPFTGKVLASNHSFLANLNVTFYRFQDEQVFYVASAGIGRGFPKCAIYFPQQDLLVTTGEPWTVERADVVELKARMLSSASLCCDYLSDRDSRKRKLAVCVGSYHFAHHLWNELSGLHRLHRAGLLDKVSKFLVMREPLGAITQIFPELRPEHVDHKDSTKDLFEEILSKRYFAVRVGDNFIVGDLADRVFRVARQNSDPTTISKIASARKRHSILLWIGIRIGSRSWANQVEGLSNLIGSLLEHHPTLGVVFDGFSVPGDRSADSFDNSEYAEVIRQENDVVAAVSDRLRGSLSLSTGIFNIVGSSIFDANAWAHSVDFYIAPYGTIQHKVGWLANKPGIIHTNGTLLEHPSRHIWSVVENTIKPHYAARQAIRDIRDEKCEPIIYRGLRDLSEAGAGLIAGVAKVQGDPEFDNYTVDWMSLRDQVLQLIDSRPGFGRLGPSVWFDRSVVRVARAVQTALDFARV